MYIKRNLESVLFLASSFLQHESEIKKTVSEINDKWTQTFTYSDSSWFSILESFHFFLVVPDLSHLKKKTDLAKLSHKPPKLHAPSPAVSKIVGDVGDCG